MTFRNIVFAALAAFSLGLGAAAAKDHAPNPCPEDPVCVTRCGLIRDHCFANGGLGSQCVPAYIRCVDRCPNLCGPPVLQ